MSPANLALPVRAWSQLVPITAIKLDGATRNRIRYGVWLQTLSWWVTLIDNMYRYCRALKRIVTKGL